MCYETSTLGNCLTKQNSDVRDTETVCTEFEGISLNPNPEIIGVADMANEACSTVALGVTQKTSFIVPDKGYQDLLDYLARPRLISSLAVPTSRQNFLSADLNRTNLLSWFPNLLNRLAGVHGIRFTTKFTVTVANTPFQQALLCQSFQYGTNITNSVIYNRCLNSTFATNLPHVLHDIAETSMSQLEVPFLYTYDYLPLYTGVKTDQATGGCIGVWGINTIMPYRVIAGVNAPLIKLYVSLHDVELIGSMPNASTVVVTQSGLGKTNPIIEEEKQVSGSSQLLELSSKVRTISSYIPYLSSIGSTTSNMMDKVAGVARAFGYAKPQVVEPPHRVWRTNNVGETNIDMPSDAFVLAPFQSNRLAVDSMVGGTDVDEMAIQYVIGKYGQVFQGTFTTSDSVGTPLYATSVCPTNFWFRLNAGRPGGNLPLPAGATALTNSIALSPLLYVAQFFRYWRGTLKFRFTFSKTKFHGGRVIVGYVPEFDEDNTNGVLSSSVPSVEVAAGLPQPFSYSTVFDLRDGSSFEFEVPYVSPTPFTNILSSIGGLTMTVLDPLVSSGETSAIIDYLVEVAACEDFEFGCPAPPMFSPAVPSAPIAFLQSGLGGVADIDTKVSQYTTGESFLSLKQLMMIPSWIVGDVPNSTLNATYLWPFHWFGRLAQTVPMANTATTAFGFTRSGLISAMYAYVTGSTEHHVYLLQGSAAGLGMSISAVATNNATAASSLGDPRTRSATGTQRVLTTDNALHVRVPSYQRTPRLLVSEGNVFGGFAPGTSVASGSSLLVNQAQLLINNQTGAPVRIVIGRAAGDDARCATYVGPPPVLLLQGTQSVNPDFPGTAIFS